MDTQQNRFLDPDMIVSRVGIKAGMQVADLGCGTGHLILSLARAIAPDGHAYAVDIDPQMVSSARSYVYHEGYRNATFIVSDLVSDTLTEIPEMTMDLVVLSNTLHEISAGRETVIEKAKNLLKKDGQLLVVEWQKKDTLFGPPVASRLDQSEVVAIMQSHGFDLRDSFDAGGYHYGALFEVATSSEQTAGIADTGPRA